MECEVKKERKAALSSNTTNTPDAFVDIENIERMDGECYFYAL